MINQLSSDRIRAAEVSQARRAQGSSAVDRLPGDPHLPQYRVRIPSDLDHHFSDLLRARACNGWDLPLLQ